MKIDSAQISLGSQYSFTQHHHIEESLIQGNSQPGSNWSEDNIQNATKFERSETFNHFNSYTYNTLSQLTQQAQDTADSSKLMHQFTNQPDNLSTDRQALQPNMPAQQLFTASIALDEQTTVPAEEDTKLQILVAMIEAITGKKLKLLKLEDIQQAVQEQQGTTEITEPASAGWGLRYHYSESFMESEQTQFTAQGIIKTADGKTIHIDLQLNMSRKFVSHHNIDIVAGNAKLKDPLVVNFNGTAAQLSTNRLNFDIDADGENDQIAVTRPDSGFLALDKNNDGIINNGSELFGAISGNGFADLSQYDEDTNNFIDENDDIYNKLRIWVHSGDGNSQLLALGEANVGAIYLGNIETAFDIRNPEQQLQGKIRSSGIYLGDDGSAGSIQQLDLVV